jgi:hypothetical protein
MIQPVEMRSTLPMTLHGGASSTTTDVWEMLSASRDGDLDGMTQLIARRRELSTCQFNYTPPLHFAVREGHLPLVRVLVEHKALDPSYKTYPFGESLLTMAQDRGDDEIARFLQDALANPDLTRKWVETGEIDYRQDEGQRQFDQAVHAGQLREVERLLNGCPDPQRALIVGRGRPDDTREEKEPPVARVADAFRGAGAGDVEVGAVLLFRARRHRGLSSRERYEPTAHELAWGHAAPRHGSERRRRESAPPSRSWRRHQRGG